MYNESIPLQKINILKTIGRMKQKIQIVYTIIRFEILLYILYFSIDNVTKTNETSRNNHFFSINMYINIM